MDKYTIQPTSSKIEIKVDALNIQAARESPSQVKIENVEFIYSPTDSSYTEIESRTEEVGFIAEANTSNELDIRVALNELKSDLSFLKTTGEIYRYNVTLRFKVIELSSGKSGTIETVITVRFANFADS